MNIDLTNYKVSPLTMIFLVDGNKILTLKRSSNKQIYPNKISGFGGKVEPGEDLIASARREFTEETEYKVDDITLLTINYHPNQPNNDRQNICFVFFCEAKEKEGESDWEVSEQQWFDLANLPNPSEIAFDHYDDIKVFLKYKKEQLSLPIFS